MRWHDWKVQWRYGASFIGAKGFLQGLYDGMVTPFVNMTIRAWTWYQGENNLGHHAGNVLDHSGYACLLQLLVSSWRDIWSVEPGTTSPEAPFGVVMLADATDEGWGCNVPQMHWAETGNMGYAPNEHLPKVFLATGHDAGDPWDDPCRGAPFCCLDTGKPVDKSCGPHRNFLAQTGQYPGTNEPVTPYFMGSIHPRTKKLVAQRLAKAAWAIVYEHDTPFTGPVLSGCGLSSDKSQLIIRFNDTFMFGDDLMVTNYSRNEQASAMFVRINVPLPDDAARNSLYENRKPWWGDEDTWVNVDIAAGPTPGKHEVVADLSKLPHNAVVTGVKYGHSIPGVFPQSGHFRVCCGTRNMRLDPCPPDSCPIKSSNSQWPAMPFMARIEQGTCKCLEPQVCDEVV